MIPDGARDTGAIRGISELGSKIFRGYKRFTVTQIDENAKLTQSDYVLVMGNSKVMDVML